MGRPRSDIAPRLISSARARFLQEGVDGSSLRAIAADAGTSIGMLYYYFKTKDDLFFAVVETVYARILDDIAVACAVDVPAKERVRRLYRRIGAIDELEAQTIRLVIREVLVSSKRLRRLLARFRRGHIPLVLQTIGDGIADGTIRKDRPAIVLLLAAVGVGVIPQFVLPQVRKTLGAPTIKPNLLADVLVDVLWNGIGPRHL